jgi:hypothetical protein
LRTAEVVTREIRVARSWTVITANNNVPGDYGTYILFN